MPLGLIPAYAGRTKRPRATGGHHQAHPRLRGADAKARSPEATGSGSSPLTRGGPRKISPKPINAGLIPAYAGRTAECGRMWSSSRAHPRLRGADNREELNQRTQAGSSPLTRGGLVEQFNVARVHGLIPAYAGRTQFGGHSPRGRRAHPRLRGADRTLDTGVGEHRGSSPLTRGGRQTSQSQLRLGGLIPDYAGRTPAHLAVAPSIRAHPRLRGADSEVAG